MDRCQPIKFYNRWMRLWFFVFANEVRVTFLWRLCMSALTAIKAAVCFIKEIDTFQSFVDDHSSNENPMDTFFKQNKKINYANCDKWIRKKFPPKSIDPCFVCCYFRRWVRYYFNRIWILAKQSESKIETMKDLAY